MLLNVVFYDFDKATDYTKIMRMVNLRVCVVTTICGYEIKRSDI